jgi:glycosyltransferase involved in cell wall biosynthesis
MIQYSHELPGEEDDALRYGPAFWLGGGSAAVDRAKFAALGGFDSLLQPLYAEDLDLSYMAWKRGWKVLFCPASKVIHKHRSTSGRMDRRSLDRLIERNHLLFIWKNVTDPGMIAGHLLSLPLLPWRRSWRLSLRDTLAVVAMAVAHLPHALARRDAVRRDARVSDRQIFQVANDALAYKQEFVPPREVQEGERLNILFVTPYYPSLRHGGGVRMYQMIRALSRQHAITLLTFWDSEEDREYFREVESFCQRVVMIERHPVTCRPLIPTFPPAITLDFGDPQFGAALRKLLIEGDFDIVQCEFLQTGYQIPRLRREVLVLTEHEVQNAAQLTSLGLERKALNRIHNAFQWARWMLAEMVLASRFDSIVGVTEEDAWSVKRYDPRLPVEVIHTCVDVAYYEPQPPECEDADSLVYLGNFAHLPNVDSALLMVNEILPLVRAEIPGVKFYIVGANPTAEIQALAEPGEVIVTGWVDDTRTYLAKARLAVFPIRLGVGIRTKILESMAMGKAVITTPLGTAGLCPEHGKNIWVAEGVENLAQGVITLLRDPTHAERIGAQAREFVVTRRSWESAAALQAKSYYRHLQQRDAGYAARRFQTYSTEPFHRPIGWRLGYLTTAAAYLVVPARGMPYILNGWRSLGKPNPFHKQ